MRCGWFVVPSWLAGVSLFGLVCFASCSGDASNLVETDVTTGAADTPPTFIDTAGSSDARVDPDGGATQDIAEPLLDTQSADVTLADAPPASGAAAPFLDVDPSDEDLGSAETLSSADVPALIDVDEPDTGPTITCTAVASVLSPLAGEFFATGTDIEFKAQVVDPSESWPLTDHVVRWTLENGAVLGETAVSADGSASWTGAISISGNMSGAGIGVENIVWQPSTVAFNSAVQANVGSLGFLALAGSSYQYEAYMPILPAGGTSTGFSTYFDAGTCYYTVEFQTTQTSTFNTATSNVSGTAPATAGMTGTTPRTARITGTIYSAGNANVAIQAQTSAANIDIQSGAYLTYTRIS